MSDLFSDVHDSVSGTLSTVDGCLALGLAALENDERTEGEAADVDFIPTDAGPYQGCFDIESDSSNNLTLVRCWYRVEQVIYSISDGESVSSEGFYALKIPCSNPSNASIQKYSGPEGMNNDAMDDRYLLIPLYQVSDSDPKKRVITDFRSIPTAQAWFGTAEEG